MVVEFILREPGNHHTVAVVEDLENIPRVGDSVALSSDRIHEVHSVTWLLPQPPRKLARVLVLLKE